ncbi:MAG: hypothetical protein WBG57_12735 [Ornithinimicrobium sp.]
MTTSPSIAIATAAEVAELDDEGKLLAQALRARGAVVTPAVWNDADVDWAAYDLVVVRSTWDYPLHRSRFLEWAERVETTTRLLNSAELLAWNTDKRYLHDLERSGLPIVASRFISAHDPVEHEWLDAEHVVKPSVSAGARDTLRLGAGEADRSRALIRDILASGRSALIQPYLAEVDSAGETAMLFYDGEFSHAICKDAILTLGSGLVEGLFAPEVITARTPSEAEMALGRATMAAIGSVEPPLYARVDALPSPTGPVVLEVELTEPSMFFEYAEGSAGRFADSILRRLV